MTITRYYNKNMDKSVHRYAVKGEREREREKKMLWKLRYSIRDPSITEEAYARSVTQVGYPRGLPIFSSRQSQKININKG